MGVKIHEEVEDNWVEEVIKDTETEKWQESVKRKLKERHSKFIDAIQDDVIRKIINEKCFIAGGSISSLIRNEEPNDIDYFVEDEESLNLIKTYFKIKNEIHNEFNGNLFKLNKVSDTPEMVTENAISFADKYQIITKRFGSPRSICDEFDFLHCMGYYVPKENKLDMPEEYYKLSKDMKLVLNRDSDTPVFSSFRMVKLVQRGWSIDRGEQYALMLQLRDFDFSEIDENEEWADYQ